MRLVAGQKYVRGPAGEIMPYTPGVEKITGCVVFVQNTDQADTLQLPENENLPKFRGRRMVDVAKAIVDPKPEVAKQEVKSVKPKPVPVSKTFEHMDIRQDMDYDLKQDKGTTELTELE